MDVSQRQSVSDIISKLRTMNSNASSPSGGKGKTIADLPQLPEADFDELAAKGNEAKLTDLPETEVGDLLVPDGAVIKVIFFGKELKGSVRIKDTGVKEGSLLQAFVIEKEEFESQESLKAELVEDEAFPTNIADVAGYMARQ
jgi:hypothetical protein